MTIRQRVTVEIWYDSTMNLEDIELNDISVGICRLGFEFDKSEKVTLLRNRAIADTVLLNGTIEASVTVEDFTNRLKELMVVGVNFKDYIYPRSLPSCCDGFGFITTSDGQRFLGKQTLWLEGD